MSTSSSSSSSVPSVDDDEADSRTRDLFGIQLEVTNLLLEAERRKLKVLQKELSNLDNSYGPLKKKELELQKQYISRIQQQYDQLEKEYNQAAMGLLKQSNRDAKSSRSQPAIGLKQTPKSRPTIFGTITNEKLPLKENNHKSLPQTHSGLTAMFSPTSGTRINGSCNGHLSINDSDALVFQNGNLVSGPLEALVQHLVPTADYYPDRTYLFAFLLSSRLFIKPHELLSQICQVCMFQQHLTHDDIKKEKLGDFCNNMIRLLSEWAETFPYDFRDERMMKHLKDLTQRCVQIDINLRKEVGQMIQNLVARLAGLEKYEEFLARVHTEAAQRLISTVPTTDIYEVCPSATVLSQQLTHIELERLSNIGPEEFVQAFAKENPNVETTFRDMKKTRNLESYVQWFNRLSYFVATEICTHLKKKHRLKIIEYFIDVAKECFNIGNFNSLMAIIAGMNMNPVTRLKKTWAKVNTAKLEILEHQMDPSSNFTSYRSTLKAAMWRSQGAVDDREKIVIPFFSLLVKDLYFLNEGCANRLPSGHINLEKFWQLAKQVTEFITWKQVACPFERQSKVLHYLLTNPVFSESALALASFECEPPENSYEKERHKQLKLVNCKNESNFEKSAVYPETRLTQKGNKLILECPAVNPAFNSH